MRQSGKSAMSATALIVAVVLCVGWRVRRAEPKQGPTPIVVVKGAVGVGCGDCVKGGELGGAPSSPKRMANAGKAVSEDKARSAVQSFINQNSLPLRIQAVDCAYGGCDMKLYQESEYKQRGERFYEAPAFLGMLRAVGVSGVSASSYTEQGRTGYLLHLAGSGPERSPR